MQGHSGAVPLSVLNMETLHRLGTFFILVGLALMVMFVGTIMSREINVIYLFLSLAALFIAFLLRRNKPVNESGRFRIVRQANQRSRQRRDDRMNNRYKRSDSPGGRRQPPAPGKENHQNKQEK
jgi:hypothetical protein